jgi:hypothetical protein
MFSLEFFGGPKDGEICFQNMTPAEQLFCASNEAPLMNAKEFKSMDDKFKTVRQAYFQYDLQISDENYHRYKYVGMI